MDLQYEYLVRKADVRMDVGKTNNELNNDGSEAMRAYAHGSRAYEDSIYRVIE